MMSKPSALDKTRVLVTGRHISGQSLGVCGNVETMRRR